MNFKTEINKGNLVTSWCTSCHHTVWPPSEFCDICLGDIIWKRPSMYGKIVEYSKVDGGYSCIINMDDSFTILGRVEKTPKIGQKVKLHKCGIHDGTCFFDMMLL